ncbi:cytochrome c [Nostoc ellipsosporum NOK]|nr:cytochrome c [Nostoc ellipsosporum NOK]
MKGFAAILSSYLVIFCLCSCRQAAKIPPKPFSPSILKEQVFQIDPSLDTVIITAHGARVTIPANAFAGGGKKVSVTIREAFTSAEIFAAGLTTESNGRPLRSGGMIYINATADGEMTTLVKPIGVSIPTAFFDPEMRLFKGVETDSGINWVEPDTLPLPANLVHGRDIFMAKCAACHAPDMITGSTGTPLAGVEQRWPREALYAWIRNNKALIESGYPRAVEIAKYSPTTMDLFPALSNETIDNIIAYINAATPQNYTPAPLLDCKNDTIYLPVDGWQAPVFEDINNPFNGAGSVPDTSPNNVPAVESPAINRSGYEFKITQLGWYNIDALLKIDGLPLVDIHAVPEGTGAAENLTIYLYYPEKKIMIDNCVKTDKGYFFSMDGMKGLPLIKGDRAVVFVLGEKGAEINYGVTEFIIRDSQVIPVKMKSASEKQLLEALQKRTIDGIQLDSDKTKKMIVPGNCGEKSRRDTL